MSVNESLSLGGRKISHGTLGFKIRVSASYQLSQECISIVLSTRDASRPTQSTPLALHAVFPTL